MDDLLSEGWRRREAARLEFARLQIAAEGDLEASLARANAIASEVLHVDRVGVWLFDWGANALRCISLRDRGAAQPANLPALRIVDLGAYSRALRERRAVAAFDVATEPLTASLAREYFTPLGIVSTLDAPIYRGGAVVGVVCHEHRGERREWRDADADFAISVADLVGSLLTADELKSALLALERAERQLAEALETDGVAGMARGVAHDLANLLTVLMAAADRIKRGRHSPQEIASAAADLDAAIASAERLVHQLQSWSRDGDANAAQPTRLDAAIESFGGTLRALATSERHLVIDLGAPECAVCLSPVALEQVLMNLVVNAREATAKGGLIGLSTRPAPGGSGAAGVLIEVVDDGLGMDEQTARRAFHPFFTTKDSDGHRGIGLASVRGSIDDAGGSVEVRSAPGQGSRFRVWLPVA